MNYIMRKTITFNGVEYPYAEIPICEFSNDKDITDNAVIADVELWNAIKDYCYDGWEKSYSKQTKVEREAISIDEMVYYYCGSGLISSGTSDEDLINYLKKNKVD